MRNNNNSHHTKNQSHSFLFFTVGLASFVILIVISAIIGQFTAVPVSANAGALIPEDSIRIRILANSDKAGDQAIKNKVRDEVEAVILSWGVMPATHDEARRLIETNLAKLQNRVNTKLLEQGAKYKGVVELAKVPFPEKEFNGTSYAAGDYEALRITLGQGAGVNWWCVLFPPLCLTAATASDEQPKSELAVAKGKSTSTNTQAAAADDGVIQLETESEPETKFFLWELLKKLFAFIASLFS